MTSNTQKKKPYAPMILMGVISAALYATLLTQQDVISRYFTLGGLFAFLPIATALLFSFVHGNFTGSFWTVLGVEASKTKKEVK
jgi:F0F1-type ATP synthase assembly protein I